MKLIILQNNKLENIKDMDQNGDDKYNKYDKYLYAHEDIITPTIMHCKVSKAKSIEFRSKLGFSQDNITLTKEQSVLKSVMNAFEGGNMRTQYSVLCCKADLYFCDYKLAIEVDEESHKDREIEK